MKYITLMRHGVTDSDAVFPDASANLSEKGWLQMHNRFSELGSIDQIICSPYKRCSDFARLAAQKSDIFLEVDSRLSEFNFGAWTGLTARELTKNSAFQEFSSQPFNSKNSTLPADSEDFTDFSARILDLLDAIRRAPHERTLLVTHGGVIRFLLLHVMQSPLDAWYRIRVEHAALTQLSMTDDGWMEVLSHQGEKPSC